MPPKRVLAPKKIWINKAVKGEKHVRKAKFSVPVRYAGQIYQFIDLTPLAEGRGFSLDQEDPPYVDEPQKLVDFTVFTHIWFCPLRQNNCQNTANQYLCQDRYWQFGTLLLHMIFIEDCHSSIYWLVSTPFLILMGKWCCLYHDQSLWLSNDFHRMSALTHIWDLSFSYVGASFTTFLWFGIDSQLNFFIANPLATFSWFSWVVNSDPHFGTIIS